MKPVRTVLLSFGLGTGHAQVATNLANALAPLGHACKHNPLEGWVPWDYDLLFRHGYLFLILKFPGVWDAMYHSEGFAQRDHLAPPVMRGRAIRAFEASGMGDTDLVVATQYNAMEIVADWKRETGRPLKLAAVVTDYDIYPLWARQEVDLFLVPHVKQARLLEEKGVEPKKISVTGIPIAPAFGEHHDRAAIRSALFSDLGLDGALRTAMVFGGGGGMGPLRESAAAILDLAEWQVILVCGKNDRLRRKSISLARANPERLRVLGYRTDIPALMLASDVVVTKAGALSLTEALSCGARVIVIPSLSGQEKVNIAFMVGEGWTEESRTPADLPKLLQGGRATKGPGAGAFPGALATLAAQALDRLARG